MHFPSERTPFPPTKTDLIIRRRGAETVYESYYGLFWKVLKSFNRHRSPGEKAGWSVSIKDDRFNRTAHGGLPAEFLFFRSPRLLRDVRISLVVVTREICRSRVPAKVAIYAVVVNDKLSWRVVRKNVRVVLHLPIQPEAPGRRSDL